MTTEDLIYLRDTAYNIAKSKGFFLDNQDDSAYIAAIHEELSEAFQAWNKHLGWYSVNPKPDGIYFELTDAVIRTLSYCGYKGISLKEKSFDMTREYTEDDFTDFLLKSHFDISQYYELTNKEIRDDYEYDMVFRMMSNILSGFIARVELFIEQSSNGNYFLDDLIATKLKYNMTRTAKHGGHNV
jgi:NTP pyrophosphatase (non-canonical NTP hydrolase)